MEYWSDGFRGIGKRFFRLLPYTNPVLQHSITPCGRHKFSAIKDTVISISCKNPDTLNLGGTSIQEEKCITKNELI